LEENIEDEQPLQIHSEHIATENEYTPVYDDDGIPGIEADNKTTGDVRFQGQTMEWPEYVPNALRTVGFIRVTITILSRAVRSMTHKFRGNEYTQGGQKNEARLFKFIAGLPSVLRVWEVGSFISKSHPYLLASPDAIALINIPAGLGLPEGPHPATVEFKTCNSVIVPTQELMFLKCGSEAYYNYVPYVFRLQIFLQCFVTRFFVAILIISSPKMVMAQIAVVYEPEHFSAFATLLDISESDGEEDDDFGIICVLFRCLNI
jgi:hypothetical protein